ncbi:MAG TPA: hypothetical protein VFE27_07185 [Acidobacteriaceae bacterium]|jgi:hypothetical protein|nr:hypothetical protein [Acidobacteriaceae bacterium]
MKYLFRGGDSGFKEVQGEPVDAAGPFRPWALTPDGRVVYAEWNQTGSGVQGIFDLAFSGFQQRTALRTYDKAVSQTRRREFETVLARDAGSHVECVKPALDSVTQGLQMYMMQYAHTVNGGVKEMVGKAGDVVKARCYSNTGSGRLGTEGQRPTNGSDAWEIAFQALQGTDIPKIIGIQTALANVLTRDVKLTGGQEQIYKDTANKVAPSQGFLYSWFDATQGTPLDGERRGREKTGGAAPTTTPGLTNPGLVADDGGEARKRGIDEWQRNKNASPFLKGIDDRNLVFGAGRSGTTGELLKTYRTFGSTAVDETFKQYLLACVVYLVGGGHHTCHEIFSVANLLTPAGGPKEPNAQLSSVSSLVKGAYVPGKYVRHLPESYLTTSHFQVLQEKYWDIAMLGHLHGIFR